MSTAERYDHFDDQGPECAEDFRDHFDYDPLADRDLEQEEKDALGTAERPRLAVVSSAPGDWPTLAPAALHGLAGEVVRTIEPVTEADPAGLLADFLVCFGNAAGSRPHAIADGARHPARLSVVLTGRSSKARKGTSRAQINPLFVTADPKWTADRIMGGLSTGEGLIATVADPLPAEGDNAPPAPVDKRLLIVEPEFARPLAAAKRDGSTLSHIVRDAWDSGDLRVMTRKDPLKATGAHISLVGHVTADELRRTLTSTDQVNGFANRLLFVCVTRSKLLPAGGGLTAVFH